MRVHNADSASTRIDTDHTFLSQAPASEPDLLRRSTFAHLRAAGPGSLAEHSSCVLSEHIAPESVVARASTDGGTVETDHHAARLFAEETLRLLFEVLDKRRAIDQLAPFLSASTVELVRTLSTRPLPGSRLGSASVRRVHLVTHSLRAAEIFGSYSRGNRMFAVAGRIELRNTPRRNSWTLTSVRIC